jgi:hypothetical protein
VFEALTGRKEFQVEERDAKTAADPEIGKEPIEDEVDAHKAKNKLKATSEPVSDDADDVELHRKKLMK